VNFLYFDSGEDSKFRSPLCKPESADSLET